MIDRDGATYFRIEKLIIQEVPWIVLSKLEDSIESTHRIFGTIEFVRFRLKLRAIVTQERIISTIDIFVAIKEHILPSLMPGLTKECIVRGAFRSPAKDRFIEVLAPASGHYA
jgi:hypothetical protein